MENFITATLLYVAVVALVYSSRTEANKVDREPVFNPVDIKCIFDDEEPDVEPIKPKVDTQAEVVKDQTSIESLTVKQLRVIAKERKVPQPYKLSKAELIKELSAA